MSKIDGSSTIELKSLEQDLKRPVRRSVFLSRSGALNTKECQGFFDGVDELILQSLSTFAILLRKKIALIIILLSAFGTGVLQRAWIACCREVDHPAFSTFRSGREKKCDIGVTEARFFRCLLHSLTSPLISLALLLSLSTPPFDSLCNSHDHETDIHSIW